MTLMLEINYVINNIMSFINIKIILLGRKYEEVRGRIRIYNYAVKQQFFSKFTRRFSNASMSQTGYLGYCPLK